MKEKHITSGRKKQKQNTRDKILEASQQLLEKKVTLTMENVAEKAGISRATVYRYYTNIDSLSMDLIFQLDVPNPETILSNNEGASHKDTILGIQKAYLDFSLRNEQTSRQFLAAVLASSNPNMRRGKNRINTLKEHFKSNEVDLSKEDKEKLIHLSVLLMGIESIITAKDVCGLDNQTATNTLTWGLQMILKGCGVDK